MKVLNLFLIIIGSALLGAFVLWNVQIGKSLTIAYQANAKADLIIKYIEDQLNVAQSSSNPIEQSKLTPNQ